MSASSDEGEAMSGVDHLAQWRSRYAGQLESAKEAGAELAARLRAQSWFEASQATWPTPIAHEIAQLALVLEHGDSAAALFQYRDAGEVALKLTMVTAAAHIIETGAEADRDAAIASLYAKMLSAGDWRTMPLKWGERALDCLPSAMAALLKRGSTFLRGMEDFVAFRNSAIGHGALAQDPMETMNAIRVQLLDGKSQPNDIALAACFATIEASQVWTEIELCVSDDGAAMTLSGAAALNTWRCSHGAPGAATRDPSDVVARSGGREVKLSPLIAGRRCPRCDHLDLFMFDGRADYSKTPRTSHIDYTTGHTRRLGYNDDARLAAMSAAVKAASGPARVDDGEFSNPAVIAALEDAQFDRRYLSPNYLRHDLQNFIQSADRGVFWVEAPAHLGKTMFARGLAGDAGAEEAEILPGATTISFFFKREYRYDRLQFAHGFVQACRTQLARVGAGVRDDTRQRLWLDAEAPNPAQSFVSLVTSVRERLARYRDGPMLLVIDGLDEAAGANQSALDFLPSADELPQGVYLVLTSRVVTHDDASARKRLSRRLSASDRCVRRRVAVEDGDYRELLQEYLGRELARSGAGKAGSAIDETARAIVEDADGVFLFASFLAEAATARAIAPRDTDKAGLARWLDTIRDTLPSGKIAMEADWVLAGIAAWQLAHRWSSDPKGGLESDYAKAPLIYLDANWQGVALTTLAASLGRSRAALDADDESYEPLFVLGLYRLKSALTVTRTNDSSVFGFWLPELADAIARNPTLSPLVKRAHAQIATYSLERLLERQAPDAITLLSLLRAHAALSNDERVRELVFDKPWTDVVRIFHDMIKDARERGDALTWERLAAAAMSWQLALSRRPIGNLAALPMNLSTALSERAAVRLVNHDVDGALADYTKVLEMRERLRAHLGAEFPDTWNSYLSTARGMMGYLQYLAHQPGLGIATMDQAIAETLELMKTAKHEDLPKLEGDLAALHSNRSLARESAGMREAARADRSAAVEGFAKGDDKAEVALVRSNIASELARTRQWQAALAEFDRAIIAADLEVKQRGAPAIRSLARIRINRSQVASKLGRYDESIADANAAIEALGQLERETGAALPRAFRQDLAEAWLARGVAENDAQRCQDAVASLTIGIDVLSRASKHKANTELATALLNRGNAHLQLGEMARAVADHQQALELAEGVARARKGRRYGEDRSSVMLIAFALMNSAFRAEQWDLAREAAERVSGAQEEVAGAPDGDHWIWGMRAAKAWNTLGVLAAKQSQWERALFCFTESITVWRAISPEGFEAEQTQTSFAFAEALHNRSRVLMRLGRKAEARRDLVAASQTDEAYANKLIKEWIANWRATFKRWFRRG